jgi:hypothetical protein
MEGMVFLQNYPVNVVGGMEAVLQAADDLDNKARSRGEGSPSSEYWRRRKDSWCGVGFFRPAGVSGSNARS